MSGDEEPPPEVHHYEDRGQVPWDIQKYASLIASFPYRGAPN